MDRRHLLGLFALVAMGSALAAPDFARADDEPRMEKPEPEQSDRSDYSDSSGSKSDSSSDSGSAKDGASQDNSSQDNSSQDYSSQDNSSGEDHQTDSTSGEKQGSGSYGGGSNDSADDDYGGNDASKYEDDGDADDDQYKARRAVQNRDAVPLVDVLKGFQRRFNGQVVDVRLVRYFFQLQYRLTYIDENGSVRRAYFDAKSGAFIR